MILANSDMISWYPAQLYYSALPFLPSDTYLARQYPTPRGCISVVTGRENSWTPLLFTLPTANTIAFAPGGHMVAVISDEGIQIYNASNGLLNSSTSTDIDSPCSAVFTEDGSEVVVISNSAFYPRVSYQIAIFNLVKQSGQIWRTTPLKESYYPHTLSEYGSYVAFPEHKNGDTRICIWRTDGSDDIFIPLGCGGKVRGLDLAGESVHFVAVSMEDRITILSIPSGAVQRTLYQENAFDVCISRDGSFLASTPHDGYTLWPITQGTLLARFDADLSSMVFSRTNRLYVVEYGGGGKIYDMYEDPNNITTKSFPLPSRNDPTAILPTPDESWILIHTLDDDIQVWSLRQITDTRDAPRYDIIGIDLSRDASLLAIATATGIEIWDACIGRCRKVIQSESHDEGHRHVAFSPKGELILSESNDGFIVVDVRAGELMPMRYRFSPEIYCVGGVGISFDSSKIAVIYVPGSPFSTLRVWDIPSGTLLYNLNCGDCYKIQWSWRDQYLLFKAGYGNPRYLNAETFQEEVLEHPGDHFQDPDVLFHDRTALRIRLSTGSEYPLFLALPSHLRVNHFA